MFVIIPGRVRERQVRHGMISLGARRAPRARPRSAPRPRPRGCAGAAGGRRAGARAGGRAGGCARARHPAAADLLLYASEEQVGVRCVDLIWLMNLLGLR